MTLTHYTPPSVVVDSRFDIQQIRGRITPFLDAPDGQPTTSVLRVAHEGLLGVLQNALTEAKALKTPVVREHLNITAGDRDVEFTLRVLPLTVSRPDGPWFLIVFETQSSSWSFPSVPPLDAASADANLIRLRHELAATKQYVQSILDNQDSSNQELRIAHEEVLSSNEELQSTNEELETTKEELQSSNEELITLNEQFENRNRELDVLTDDLSNFIASADVPMVTVGRDLRIRRMTRRRNARSTCCRPMWAGRSNTSSSPSASTTSWASSTTSSRRCRHGRARSPTRTAAGGSSARGRSSLPTTGSTAPRSWPWTLIPSAAPASSPKRAITRWPSSRPFVDRSSCSMRSAGSAWRMPPSTGCSGMTRRRSRAGGCGRLGEASGAIPSCGGT